MALITDAPHSSPCVIVKLHIAGCSGLTYNIGANHYKVSGVWLCREQRSLRGSGCPPASGGSYAASVPSTNRDGRGPSSLFFFFFFCGDFGFRGGAGVYPVLLPLGPLTLTL